MFDTIEKPLNLFLPEQHRYLPKNYNQFHCSLSFYYISIKFIIVIKLSLFGFIWVDKLAVITWFQVISIELRVRAAFHSKWWSSKSSVFYSFRRRLCKAHVCNLICTDLTHSLLHVQEPPCFINSVSLCFSVCARRGGVVRLNVTFALSSLRSSAPFKPLSLNVLLNLTLKAHSLDYLLTDRLCNQLLFPVTFSFWLESKGSARMFIL